MVKIDLTQNIENFFEYKTADLYEASYLKTKGFSLIGTDFISRSVYFVFNDDGAEKAGNDWKFDLTEEVKLIKKYNFERENTFALLKTAKIGGAR